MKTNNKKRSSPENTKNNFGEMVLHSSRNARTAVLWITQEAQIAFANDSCTELTGYSQEELLGMNFFNIDPLWDQQKWESEGWKNFKHRRRTLSETSILKKTGTLIPVEIETSYTVYKNGEYIIIYLADLTEKKKIDAALRYKASFEEMISVLAKRFINVPFENFEEEVQYALKQIGDFTETDQIIIYLFHEKDINISRLFSWGKNTDLPFDSAYNRNSINNYQWFLKNIMNGNTVYISDISDYPSEAQAEKIDFFTHNIISLLAIPMLYQQKIIGFIVFQTEDLKMPWTADELPDYFSIISEMFVSAIIRNRAEKKAYQQEQQLIQAAKMVSLGTLVSGMAHEVNNPNHYISMNAEIIQKLWDEILPVLKGYQKENPDWRILNMELNSAEKKIPLILSGISEGSDKIQKIVKRLKDFSRQESGELKDLVDLNRIIIKTLEMTNHLIKKSTDNFNLCLDDRLPSFCGNAQQIEQVLINLITNACHALEDKSQSINIRSYYQFDNETAAVEISDEGPGIPAESMPYIFDPFYSLNKKMGGMGLGLSISYNIMKNHRGLLNITSEEGKGTIATAVFPLGHSGSCISNE